MGLLVNRSILVILLAALALAGCASTDGGDGGNAAPPAPMSNAEARTLLTGAIADMPERYGFNMSLYQGAAAVMTFEGMVDNATGTTYFRLTGDADAIANLSGQAGGMGEDEDEQDFSEVFRQGLEMYADKTGSVILMNGTAFAFPSNESEPGAANPLSGAAGSFDGFTDSDELFEGFDENVTVTSVTPTVYRGKAAMELVVVTQEEEGQNVTSKLVVYTSPRRIAHLETTIPAEEDGENPFTGELRGDFFYDNEVKATPSPTVKRALGLAYKSDATPFGGSGSGPTTWTFQHESGIATSEIEVHVKNGQGNAMDGDLAALPNAWTMKLSDGTKTQDGVTVAFTDADGDKKVSPGDTLAISADEDTELPAILLYDTKTSTYVVPGAGLLLAALAVAAAALLARRR